MKTEQELRSSIMKRVYAVYVLRQLSQPAVRIGALLVLLFALRELVFVSKVIENASLKHNVVESAGYLLGAFAGTELIVQLVVFAVLAVTVFMAKDAMTLVRSPRAAL